MIPGGVSDGVPKDISERSSREVLKQNLLEILSVTPKKFKENPAKTLKKSDRITIFFLIIIFWNNERITKDFPCWNSWRNFQTIDANFEGIPQKAQKEYVEESVVIKLYASYIY